MTDRVGSAFAFILVTLFAVAPTSPPSAAGGIHLHMAESSGRKRWEPPSLLVLKASPT
jgi:hypothetical protein